MSRSIARARAGRDRTSPYQEISDKIITELEAGRVPSVQLWGTVAAKASLTRQRMRQRIATIGINVLILWGAVSERGVSPQDWLTFRQALGLGGNVRKGKHGTTVLYADHFVPDEERKRAVRGDEPTAPVPQTIYSVQHRSMRRPTSGGGERSITGSRRACRKQRR